MIIYYINIFSTVEKSGVVYMFGGYTHIGAESAELWTYNLGMLFNCCTYGGLFLRNRT